MPFLFARTRETVAVETWASLATSLIVGFKKFHFFNGLNFLYYIIPTQTFTFLYFRHCKRLRKVLC